MCFIADISIPVSTRILTPMRRHMTPMKQTVSSPHLPTYPEEVRPPTRKKCESRLVTARQVNRSRSTGQGLTPGHEIKPSASGQVTIAECEVIPDVVLSRPGTRLDSRLVTGGRESETNRPATALEMRPATGLETQTRPATGLETRPATGLEIRPVTGLETRPTTGLETRPTTGLLELSQIASQHNNYALLFQNFPLGGKSEANGNLVSRNAGASLLV